MRNYLKSIQSSLKEYFTNITPGKDDMNPVSTQTLKAFVGGDWYIKDWNRAISNDELTMRWVKCAEILKDGAALLKGSEFEADAINTAIAAKIISQTVKKGDIDGEYLVPQSTIRIMEKAEPSLKMIASCLFKQDSMDYISKNANTDTMYYKAAPLFDNNYKFPRYTQISIKSLELAVEPLLNDLDISEDDDNASAQCWEKLGHIAADHIREFPYGLSGGSLVREPHIRLAVALCEGLTYKHATVPILKTSLDELSQTWCHHAPAVIHEMKSQPADQINEKSIIILEKAAAAINYELAPYLGKNHKPTLQNNDLDI